MQRKAFRHLTALAAGMALAVGATRSVPAQGTPRAPAGVTAFPSDGSVLIAYGGVPNAVGYNIYRREAAQAADQNALVNAQPALQTFFIDSGLANGKPLLYSVKAVFLEGDKRAEGPASAEVVVTPHAPILGAFFWHDIGTMNPGRVTVNGNVLEIRASGDDIYDNADGQTFLAVPVAGDYTLTAKLLEKPTIEDGLESNSGKAGVQIKFSLQDGDPYAFAFASVSRDPEFMFEGRRIFGGGPDGNFAGGTTSEADAKFPVWLRLVKKEDTISALQSYDGKTFEEIFDAQEFAHLPVVTYAGITATAHSDERYINARFELSSLQITLE
jgi:hypothetical protein